MLALYQARPDIRLIWPQVLGADRTAFARWFVESSELQQTIPSCYVEPIRAALESRPVRPPHSRVSRQPPRLSFSRELVSGAMRKAAVALRERRLPLSPARWLHLYKLHTLEQSQDVAARSAQLPPVQWRSRELHGLPCRPQPSLDFGRPEALAAAQPHGTTDNGLTVVGYLGAGTGVAATADASMAACAAAGIASEFLDARPVRPIRARHATALLHVNADQLPTVAGMLGEDFFRGRYIIGAWAWELPRLPDEYLAAFGWVHEVWAASRFIQGAVAEKSPVPVVRMPYPVRVAPTAGAGRNRFQLPTDRFLFLTMYDALSIQERKNPQGAIEAFHKAFGSSGGVGLVVKVNHASSRPAELALVQRLVAETPGTYLVDGVMSREDAQALQACCDAFVSVHRAEGFGLNIAEAMLLGRPVVVTSWSGNMDFTTHRNACLVDYQMVTLTASSGPYQAGNEWAEPDVEHAAEWMQRLVADERFRNEIGRRGQQTIATGFSPAAVGRMYQQRLDWIARHFSS
jgi:glycosyltransferase involved in cell wall biosynthesis